MKPGRIETAFIGAVGRDPEVRTAQKSGREWCIFSVAVGEDDAVQWLDVACFGPFVDAAMTLAKGDRVYVEGRLSVRTWQDKDGAARTTLSVAASLVQPLGKIGEKKPRKTTAAKQPKHDPNRPLEFNDPLPF